MISAAHTLCLKKHNSRFLLYDAASAVLVIVILSVHSSRCLSVCLSATRVLCDETKNLTADILKPQERTLTLAFWYQQRLVGDVSFQLKFALKVTHPL